MALVAAVMAATSTAGASAPGVPVGHLDPAAPASATLALRVPADAVLDDPGPGDASAPGWSGSHGEEAAQGAGAPVGLTGVAGAVLTPATVRAGALPPRVRAAYVAAADRLAEDQPGCGLPWWLLAGVGQVESGHAAGGRVRDDGVTLSPIRGPRLDGTLAGTAVVRDSDRGSVDGDPAYDRAVGPMQFMPGTWASWGADGDGEGRKDPDDIDDAALAAGRDLCAGVTGGALAEQGGQAAALFRYNRSVSYGLEVIRWGIGFRDGTAAPAVPSSASAGAGAAVPTDVPDPAPSTDGATAPAAPPVTSGSSPSAPASDEPAPAPAPSEVPGEPPPSGAPVPDPSAASPAPPVPPLPGCAPPEEPASDETSTGDPTGPEPTTAPTTAPASSSSDPSSSSVPTGAPVEPSTECVPPCPADEDDAPSPTSGTSPSPTGSEPSGETSPDASPSASDPDAPADASAPPPCAPAPPAEPEPTDPSTSSPTPTGR